MRGFAMGLGKVIIPRLDLISFEERAAREPRKGFYGRFLDRAMGSI